MPQMYVLCADFRRALISLTFASAAIAIVYALAAALSQPDDVQPAAAPEAEELPTLLPCAPQQPVTLYSRMRVSLHEWAVSYLQQRPALR